MKKTLQSATESDLLQTLRKQRSGTLKKINQFWHVSNHPVIWWILIEKWLLDKSARAQTTEMTVHSNYTNYVKKRRRFENWIYVSGPSCTCG